MICSTACLPAKPCQQAPWPRVSASLGPVSLLALSSDFVGEATTTWGVAAEALLAQRWVDRDTATAMARLHAFGRLIGNSDMHQGNLGFHLVDRRPLPLAPVYDMLPMSLAPSRTGVLRAARPLAPVAPERSAILSTCSGRRRWRWNAGGGWPGRSCCARRRCGRLRPRTPAACRQCRSGLAESSGLGDFGDVRSGKQPLASTTLCGRKGL
jgi:hypothetical protein